MEKKIKGVVKMGEKGKMLAGNPIVQSGVISSPLRALADDGYPVFYFCRRAFKT